MNKETSDGDWKIGKVLQFGYYLEKTKKARQYTGFFVKCNEDNINKIGIVCSWFHKSSYPNKPEYLLQTDAVSHNFILLNSYICTLPVESFESIEAAVLDAIDGVVATPHTSKLTSAKAFTLSNETVLKIKILHKMSIPAAATTTNSTEIN